MEDLFKIDKIDGRGVGWIALQDIKVGTLIYKEKFQFAPKNLPKYGGGFLGGGVPLPQLEASLMEAFLAMSKNDQEEFLQLRNAFLDLSLLSNDKKKWFFDIKQQIQCQNRFDGDLLLKIICIHQTNGFAFGLEFKSKKINHSCCSNSAIYVNEMMNEVEIRATTKICDGQEITKNYMLDSCLEGELKNFSERQKFCHEFGFVCSCKLCQEEEINNDDETYQKLQNLKEEVEKIRNISLLSFDHFDEAIAYQKARYNLAKNKKAPKAFIHAILNEAFNDTNTGYQFARMQKNYGKMENFKEECAKFSKIGLLIAKNLGQGNYTTDEWKERNEDFENWCKKQT